MNPCVSLHHITRTLGTHPVLDDVSLTLQRGEAYALVGASGAGKSTLLNIVGLLDRPCSGRVVLDGRDVTTASAAQRAMLRNRLLGFVFQHFNLLPRLTALDNVALPLHYRGTSLAQARQAAQAQLDALGLGSQAAQRPADLSGGQRQRVAIARALVTRPTLLLADEPTGNLDGASAQDVLDVLKTLNRRDGVTLLIVTHDPALAAQMGHVWRVEQGQVIDDHVG